jgi:hypothetical protein
MASANIESGDILIHCTENEYTETKDRNNKDADPYSVLDLQQSMAI